MRYRSFSGQEKGGNQSAIQFLCRFASSRRERRTERQRWKKLLELCASALRVPSNSSEQSSLLNFGEEWTIQANCAGKKRRLLFTELIPRHLFTGKRTTTILDQAARGIHVPMRAHSSSHHVRAGPAPALTGTESCWKRPTITPAPHALPEGGLLLPPPSSSVRQRVKSLCTTLGDQSHDPTGDLVTSTGYHKASALYSTFPDAVCRDKPAPATLHPQHQPFHHLVTDALGNRKDPSPVFLSTYFSKRTHV